MFQYKIHEDGQTIEQLLRDYWRLGKKQIHELRMNKAVYKDGEPTMWKTEQPKGTELTFMVTAPASNYKPAHDASGIKIRYEDEHCLIVSKPKGMATHPNSPTDTKTCMNYVMAHITANGGTYAEHVHRLDQGTEGLLLVAKHPIAKSVMDRMIEEKTITRIYEAEVQGRVRGEEGTVNAAIGKDRHHNTRRVVAPHGQHAVTHYTVVGRRQGSTFVELKLETGRTHQIRVHMAHLGHPIVGDTLYNARETEDGDYSLHAIRLEFFHPFLNEFIIVSDK